MLVILNIALVAMVWLKKGEVREPAPRGDAKDYLVNELSMDKQQVEQFDEMRRGHFDRIRNYRDETRMLKDKLFDGLMTGRNAATDSIAKRIGELQSEIDIETFDHFSKLRAILREDQQKKFDDIIQEVLRTMGPRRGPPPGRRDGPPGNGPPL